LVEANELESILLNLCETIDNIFLEKSASPKDGLVIVLTEMQPSRVILTLSDGFCIIVSIYFLRVVKIVECNDLMVSISC
jgi:hypothetical protein